jgi:hypothetical protein
MMRRHRRRRRRRILLVGGLVAFGVHKMSKADADRIEQHTGIPPEEMTDEEIGQAMDELGIEKQVVTDDDREDGAGGGVADESGGTGDYLAELTELAKLRDQGILTDEEFEAKKKQILEEN